MIGSGLHDVAHFTTVVASRVIEARCPVDRVLLAIPKYYSVIHAMPPTLKAHARPRAQRQQC
jgi:hypothetical protein